MITTKEELLSFAIPIEVSDRKMAYQFAQQQPTAVSAEQVYRNTLAVLVTQRYLNMLGIETNSKENYSWHPLERILEDVADLYVPKLNGRLECRPVREGDRKCMIPEEVRDERLGYVVVQLNHPYQEGHLLGFLESVSVSELPLSYLHPLDELIGLFLDQTPETEDFMIPVRQWLNKTFEFDWQPPTDLLNVMEQIVFKMPSLVNRGEVLHRQLETFHRQVSREQSQPSEINVNDQNVLAKLIETAENDNIRWQSAELLWELNPKHTACPVITAKDLGLYLMGYQVALAIGILPKPDNSLLMLTRVYPLGEALKVPPGLTLSGQDATGNQFFKVEARQQDSYIQFKFTADEGDRFSIHVTLGNASFTENFVV